jgi:hypothetical protein
MRRLLPVLMVLSVPMSGCYRYVAARAGAVPAGTEVRLHLSQEAATRVEPVIGTGLQQVDGTLEQWATEVVLGVRVPTAEGAVDRGLRNRVVFTPAEVIAIEVREKDRAKTYLLTGALTAVGVGAVIAAISGVFGGSQNTDPPVEEDSRVPVFRVPWFP